MKSIYLLLVICYLLLTSATAQTWTKVGTGTHALNANNAPYAITSDSTGNIYVSGSFTDSITPYIGHHYVAKWDGTNWSRLGGYSHIFNSSIRTMAADRWGNIYAAGNVSDTTLVSLGHKCVYKWDGTNWSALGSGSHALPTGNYTIRHITVDRAGNVYAIGDGFTDANGNYFVEKWDGTSWDTLGKGSHALNANDIINTLVLDGAGNLYVGGNFTDSANSAHGSLYVAKWDGTNWSKLGVNGINEAGDIAALDFDGAGNLYASGFFQHSYGNNQYIAKWNGSNWSKVGQHSASSGIFLHYASGIYSMQVDKCGKIYVVSDGYTNPIDSSNNEGILFWDGNNWNEQQKFHTGTFQNMSAYKQNNILYAGGNFKDSITGEYPVLTHQIQLECSIGIEGIANNTGQISIYPNPANTNLTISQLANLKMIEVYDVVGRKLEDLKMSRLGNEIQIQVSDLAAGIYFIKATDEKGNVKNAKFVKE